MMGVDAIRLSRHEGGNIELELPSRHDNDADAKFDRLSRVLATEWSLRRAAVASKPQPGPQPWLSKAAYVVLHKVLDEDLEELFERRILRHGGYLQGQHNGLNPFQHGLIALFAHHQAAMPRQTRERIGKELWCAYRHYVPPAFLLGFLGQVRPTGLPRHSLNGVIDPAFEQWIIEQRLQEHDEHDARGPYPRTIQRETNRLRREKGERDSDWHHLERNEGDEDDEDDEDDYTHDGRA